MPITLEYLQSVCLPQHYGTQRIRSWAAKPFFGIWDNLYWTVATDGKILVAVAGRVSDEIETSTQGVPAVRSYLEPVPRDGWYESVPLSLLKSWCGGPVYVQPCPSCKGTAKDNEYVHCAFCDGDGTIGPEAKPGIFLGDLIGRNILAKGLRELSGGTVRLSKIQYKNLSKTAQQNNPCLLPIVLETTSFLRHGQPEWRVVLMTMNGNAPDPKEKEPHSVFGDGLIAPKFLHWNEDTPIRLAQQIAADRDDSGLGILSDALEESGYNDGDILGHLRGQGNHGKCCWVVELILNAAIREGILGPDSVTGKEVVS
jgi:hypothetical protein